MAHVFYNTFFNLEKYLDNEQRDPFAVQKVQSSCVYKWSLCRKVESNSEEVKFAFPDISTELSTEKLQFSSANLIKNLYFLKHITPEHTGRRRDKLNGVTAAERLLL